MWDNNREIGAARQLLPVIWSIKSVDKSEPPPRQRRARYPGRNPRKFHEKYKELSPERYASDIHKIIQSGKTPAGMHRAIMFDEVMQVLAPGPGDIAVDCTLGFGGHAR